MVLFLTAVSGIAWTIVYIVSILIGVKQETYAIPVAALALNIAWESIYTVHGLATDVSLQAVINLVWAMADVAIVYTYFRYGRRELPNFVTRPMFVAWGIAIFVTAYVVQWLFVLEFDWSQAARYSAFLQNLLMSGLFIAMFVARRGDRGQGVLIAAAKWIGTLAPTIVFGAIEGLRLHPHPGHPVQCVRPRLHRPDHLGQEEPHRPPPSDPCGATDHSMTR